MSFRRLFLALICGSVFIASAGAAAVAFVVAAHSAVSALVGDDYAWAILFGVIALAMGVAAAVVSRIIAPSRPARAVTAPRDPAEEAALRFVRDRPIVAVALAALGALVAARNPRYLGAAARAFLTRQRTPAT